MVARGACALQAARLTASLKSTPWPGGATEARTRPPQPHRPTHSSQTKPLSALAGPPPGPLARAPPPTCISRPPAQRPISPVRDAAPPPLSAPHHGAPRTVGRGKLRVRPGPGGRPRPTRTQADQCRAAILATVPVRQRRRPAEQRGPGARRLACSGAGAPLQQGALAPEPRCSGPPHPPPSSLLAALGLPSRGSPRPHSTHTACSPPAQPDLNSRIATCPR